MKRIDKLFVLAFLFCACVGGFMVILGLVLLAFGTMLYGLCVFIVGAIAYAGHAKLHWWQ